MYSIPIVTETGLFWEH